MPHASRLTFHIKMLGSETENHNRVALRLTATRFVILIRGVSLNSAYFSAGSGSTTSASTTASDAGVSSGTTTIMVK